MDNADDKNPATLRANLMSEIREASKKKEKKKKGVKDEGKKAETRYYVFLL